MGYKRTAEERLADHERKTRRTEVELARQRNPALDELYKLHRKLVTWSIDHKLACNNATHEAIAQLGRRIDGLVEIAITGERATMPATSSMFDQERPL